MLSDHEAWLVERLSRVAPSLRTRRMFGGVGLYSADVFFALIAGDVLYVKVDDESRPAFEARGMGPFQPFADKPSMRAYYELPPDALDDVRRLRPWVEAALRAARSKQLTGRAKSTGALKSTRPVKSKNPVESKRRKSVTQAPERRKRAVD